MSANVDSLRPEGALLSFFSISSQLPFVRRRDKANLLLLFYRDGRKLQFLSFTLALIRQDSEKCAALNLDRWSLCLARITQNEFCDILARSNAEILWCHLMSLDDHRRTDHFLLARSSRSRDWSEVAANREATLANLLNRSLWMLIMKWEAKLFFLSRRRESHASFYSGGSREAAAEICFHLSTRRIFRN